MNRIDSVDEMSAAAFRSAYGVPVISLGETRETLNMEREALREVYGDTWRDDMNEWLDDSEEEEEEAEREEPVTMRDARGYGWSVTNEMVDGLED